VSKPTSGPVHLCVSALLPDLQIGLLPVFFITKLFLVSGRATVTELAVLAILHLAVGVVIYCDLCFGIYEFKTSTTPSVSYLWPLPSSPMEFPQGLLSWLLISKTHYLILHRFDLQNHAEEKKSPSE